VKRSGFVPSREQLEAQGAEPLHMDWGFGPDADLSLNQCSLP
jgi:hypothetical protein